MFSALKYVAPLPDSVPPGGKDFEIKLLLLGVPEGAAMDVMGWSNSGMTKRYQHPSDELRKDIADRIGGFLWSSG